MRLFFKALVLNRVLQKTVILAGIGIAVYLILPQITVLENSWQVLITLDVWIFGLALLAQVISYLGSGFLLQSVLVIAHQRLSLWRNTLIILGAASIGLVTGGMIGGAVAIHRWTGGGKRSGEGASLASLVLQVFNTIVLLLFSIFGLAHMVMVNDLTQTQSIAFGVTLGVLIVVVGGAGLAVRFRSQSTSAYLWLSDLIPRLLRKSFDLEAARQKANSYFHAWDSLWHKGWIRPAMGAFLNISFDMLTLYLLFQAAEYNVSLGVLLAGYGLPLLLGKVAFFIPGGVGVVEGSMAALYVVLGVPKGTTAVVVLAYRLISFWIPSLVGFPIAAYLRRTRPEPSLAKVVNDPD